MKKILSYILILIVLVGLFAPTKPTFSQDATTGVCTVNIPARAATPSLDAVEARSLTLPNQTYAQCEAAARTSGGQASFLPSGSTTPTTITASSAAAQPKSNASQGFNLDYGCDFPFITEMGCLAGFSYMIWTISAFIAELAGKFLDFFVYYSTDSSSYNNTFITKGWGAVRDVANIFFIIALLYIAIKTILNLEGSHSKKLIANIVVVALIINFSLFTTKVVIDATNILAKVFYNNITPIGSNGQPLPPELGEQKSISVGLVDKYDPQSIFNTQSKLNYLFLK